jgi:hypothetical protein
MFLRMLPPLLVPALLSWAVPDARAQGPAEAESFSGPVLDSERAGSVLRRVRGPLEEAPGFFDEVRPVIGTYALGSRSGDVRVAPSVVTWKTPDGTLVARFRRVIEGRRVDLLSGRPLMPGAPPAATCATGAEPGCLAHGDVAASTRHVFESICSQSLGFDETDPSRCGLDFFRSTVFPFGAPFTIAQFYSQIFAGSAFSIDTVSRSEVGASIPWIPLVSLSIDLGDDLPTGFFAQDAQDPFLLFALPGFSPNHNPFQTLAQVLTPQQQGLAGCGLFYGTSCDGGADSVSSTPAEGGIDLLHTEAGALFQAFAPLDESFRANDPSMWQPGTLGSARPDCDRNGAANERVVLPGCRGLNDGGFLAGDGADPLQRSVGFPAGVGPIPPLGSFELGPIVFAQGHPFTGQIWRSEIAALSWNFQMYLVSITAPPDPPDVPEKYGFDPSRPYRLDGCSYVKPQLCGVVQLFLLSHEKLMPDDPTGRPVRRWDWQNGAEYAIESATGRFGPFAGGTLFGNSPHVAQTADASTRVAFGAFPPTAADEDADGVPNASDRCPASFDPGQADTDADGVGNACDDCVLEANPDQSDTNADGYGNLCDADLNGDGVVNAVDLARLKSVFFKADADADLDGNGVVNAVDLARLKASFFKSPGPSALAPLP